MRTNRCRGSMRRNSASITAGPTIGPDRFFGDRFRTRVCICPKRRPLSLDEQAWAIRYLVIDTRKWWPGKKVLLSPEWISWVSWPEAKVYVDLDRDTVQRAPEYKPAAEITREYEMKLFEHYNREPYWNRTTSFCHEDFFYSAQIN